MEQIDAVTALAALAQPHRLRVFRRLVVAGLDGLTPGVLAQGLGIPPATLSFHLKELLHADLITQQRSGRHLVYRVRFERMQGLLTFLADNCCGGEPCAEVAAVCNTCTETA